MIVWLIGLSGSGKTTLCEDIIEILRSSGKSIVKIDGDQIREMFGNDLSHSIKDRLKNAQRISTLCKMLDDNGIDAICAILSFHEKTREWNRKNIKNYYEVFIDSPLKDCIKRDPKGIYQKYFLGNLNNVVGLDLNFEIPKAADLIIKNDGKLESLLGYKSQIADIFYENK